MNRAWGWTVYALAWLLAATVWAFAAATTARLSPLQTFPYGALTMGIAAAMGVAVWRLTHRLPWRSGARFWAIHFVCLIAYAVVYATSIDWFFAFTRGDFRAALSNIRTSPATFWNLLMGSWLYLVVAGLSYVVRAERRAAVEAAAASRARLEMQQAQLAALRAQINPHFLFNALHSVGALVESNPRAADEALERLGDLLRYALADQDEVPLSREWRFTSDYVAFERLRLGDRLTTDFDVDDEALDVCVPALVLQPLVENAVRHGIAPCPDGGRLSVSAHVGDGELILHVADTGSGPNGSGGQEGLGMGSVRRRLEARYGGRASLSVDARNGHGYAVTVKLPVERMIDAGVSH